MMTPRRPLAADAAKTLRHGLVPSALPTPSMQELDGKRGVMQGRETRGLLQWTLPVLQELWSSPGAQRHPNLVRVLRHGRVKSA
jgi:hypothetical protein